MTVRRPEKKLESIRKAARNLNLLSSSPRKLASLIGKVRYASQIHTHLTAWIVELEIFKNQLIKEKGWDMIAPLPQQVKEEIKH
mmetsp:Transcript_14718/g.20551  ORF Transcript_14718/g.20551 Transcript_14718/m.20551 type:complete len:84 (+) Transcript_14718:1238-1489(+)